MSDGNGILTRGSGVHRLDPPKKRSRFNWPAIITTAVLGSGGGFSVVKIAEAKADAAAKQRTDDRLEQHDKEIGRLFTAVDAQGNRILDIAYWMGVPPDARNMPNLGVHPMPAAVHPKPKPMEPQ